MSAFKELLDMGNLTCKVERNDGSTAEARPWTATDGREGVIIFVTGKDLNHELHAMLEHWFAAHDAE